MSSVSAKFNAGKPIAAGRAGATKGLGQAMEHLLGASRKKVPHEEGTLERSGTAIVEELEGAVYYDTVYAVIQHEREDFRHDPGRTWKYLEHPAVEEKDTMVKLVQAQVRRALR